MKYTYLVSTSYVQDHMDTNETVSNLKEVSAK